jgi:hypothetical protein
MHHRLASILYGTPRITGWCPIYSQFFQIFMYLLLLTPIRLHSVGGGLEPRTVAFAIRAASRTITSYTIRLAVTLFSCIFTGEGFIEYIGCDSTEHRGHRLELRP